MDPGELLQELALKAGGVIVLKVVAVGEIEGGCGETGPGSGGMKGMTRAGVAVNP